MAENVFILGAGASKDAGAPLMSEFIDSAEDLYRHGKFGNDSPKIGKVFEALVELQRVHAKSDLDLDNIETLFGALEMARITGKLGAYSTKEIEEIREGLIKLIVGTLERMVRFTDNFRVGGSYQHFVTLLSESAYSNSAIITFNYDIALDQALYIGDRIFDYNLSPTTGGKIDYLKLHGSINWGFAKGGAGKIVPYDIEEFIARSTFPPSRDGHIYLNIGSRISQVATGVDPLPVIVPPTWNKSEYHQGSLRNVWSKTASALSLAANIYVVGYSLPSSDLFFRYLFALGTMSERRLRRFWVFDPDPEVGNRFSGLLGAEAKKRFDYKQMNFERAIAYLHQNPSSITQ